MNSLKQALIHYGTWLMTRQLGRESPRNGPLTALIDQADFTAEPKIQRARDLLGDHEAAASEPAEPGRLSSIFSYLSYDDRFGKYEYTVQSFGVLRRVLDIDLTHYEEQTSVGLWEGFWDRLQRLEPGWGLFETFTSLMARYGWNVRGTLPDDCVSVYEQFKAVTALAHVLVEGEEDVLLVAGDLPGIQEMLYTITSAGAAKALRGRSFYLQLLNDALVRTLLRELELPSTCVVYNAGGNFQLLARSSDEETLVQLRREVNHRLLRLHGGELSLALTWVPVLANDLTGYTFADAVEKAADQLARQKARAFADLAEESYDEVFAPTGFGGLAHCDVCHVDLTDDNRTRCDQCASFGERIDEGLLKGKYGLARKIADTAGADAYFTVHDLGGLRPMPDEGSWEGKPAWWTVTEAFGFKYEFAEKPEPDDYAYFYLMNDTDCLRDEDEAVNPKWVYGFRFLANTTPRITPAEYDDKLQRERLQACLEPDDDPIMAGNIRSTSIMAGWDRAGIDRYGVLRMDIDNLGALFSQRLDKPNLLRTSALSASISLFFEGWLNRLCESAAQAWQDKVGKITDDSHHAQRVKLPYVIYAGGDDLFIVGPWDVLPVVAWHVRRDLASYVLRGHVEVKEVMEYPPITISAGIFAETAKFPLYQAADQAYEALSAAKRRTVRRQEQGAEKIITMKDAINFIGTTVSWEEFRRAEELTHKLARLIDKGVSRNSGPPDKAPHALIQLLAAVAQEYEKAGGDVTEDRLPYGRWMPLLAYGLRRMLDRVPAGNQELRQEMMGLADDTLDLTRSEDAVQWLTIRFLGLPVRWAEFLIRKGG